MTQMAINEQIKTAKKGFFGCRGGGFEAKKWRVLQILGRIRTP